MTIERYSTLEHSPPLDTAQEYITAQMEQHEPINSLAVEIICRNGWQDGQGRLTTVQVATPDLERGRPIVVELLTPEVADGEDLQPIQLLPMIYLPDPEDPKKFVRTDLPDRTITLNCPVVFRPPAGIWFPDLDKSAGTTSLGIERPRTEATREEFPIVSALPLDDPLLHKITHWLKLIDEGYNLITVAKLHSAGGIIKLSPEQEAAARLIDAKAA